MFANVNAPDGSENAYYTAVQNIEAAIAALDAKAVTDTAKLDALEAVVDTYRDVDSDDYVLFTYDRFEDAYDRAAGLVDSQVAPEGATDFVAPALAEFDLVYAKAQLELWGGRLLKKAPVKTHLASAIETAEELDASNYSSASWDVFEAAYVTAVDVNEDDSAALLQTTINDARIALLKAQYDLVFKYIYPVSNSSVIVDYDSSRILGVPAGSANISSFVTAVSGHNVTWDGNTDSIATGSKVSVYVGTNSNNVVATYTAVVYGDINGDGAIDEMDQEILYVYLLDDASVISTGSIEYIAADVDRNGSVTAEDYEQLFGPLE